MFNPLTPPQVTPGSPTGPASPGPLQPPVVPVDQLVPPNPLAPTQMAQKYEVSPQMVQQYMLRGMDDPKYAALSAALDKLWADIAKQFGILTGESAHDRALWNEHWNFTQGHITRDPMHDNPEAIRELQDRIMEIAKKVVE